MTPSIQPAETLVTRPDATVELLADQPSIAVAAARFAPGVAPVPPPHAAAEHTEVFLLLDGALHFLVGKDELVAGADTVVVVPPGVVYTLRTESETRFVDFHAPSSGHGAFLRAPSVETDEREDTRARGTFDQQPVAEGAHPSVVIARVRGIDGEAITERAGRRVTLYVDNEHLTLTEHEYGPGKRGARPHVHHDHSDAFLVLEGEVQITFESGPLRASAGTFVLIPPEVVHSFDNASDAAARFFNVHAPACGFGDYLRGRNPGFDQHDPPQDGGADPASIVVRTFDMGA